MREFHPKEDKIYIFFISIMTLLIRLYFYNEVLPNKISNIFNILEIRQCGKHSIYVK